MTRSFDLPGANKVHFNKHPRYGFWTANFDKGGMPASLSGSYLDFYDLFRKVDYYLQHREKNPCKIGEELTSDAS